MKRIGKIILLCTAMLITTGCASNTQENVSQPVKIGVIAPLSGPMANYGEDAVQAYKYVLELANQQDQIELIVEDGKCSGKDARSAAQKLISVDQVQTILAFCGPEIINAGKLANEAGIPILSPVASIPSISQMGDYVYRYYNDADGTKIMGEFFEEEGVSNIAVLYENTDFGNAYADAVKENTKTNIVFDQKFNTDEKDFGLLARQLENSSADIDFVVIVLNSDTTGLGLIRALDEVGLTETFREKIIGNEIIASESMLTQIPGAMEGMYALQLPAVELADSAVQDFVTKYQETESIKSNGLFVAIEAELMQLISDIVAGGATTAAQIQEELQLIDSSNRRSGYIGNYYFNQYGDVQGMDMIIQQVEDGKLVLKE